MSTGTNSSFPKARTADLITERVGDELVVYDGKSSEAHCLSPLASAVFVAADGKTSTADLAAIASRKLNEAIDVPAVEQALLELEGRELVETIAVDGISRRRFMQRSAAVGGVVVAGTMVTSVVTPAYGGTGSTGTFGAWSSLAVLFEYNNEYYGAHWNASSPPTNAAPNDWDADKANANCVLSIPSGATLQSDPNDDSISGVTATTSTSSITITVPIGVTIVSVAAFFGQGGTGCNGCQTYPGGQSDSSGTITVSGPVVSGSSETYTLTFAC